MLTFLFNRIARAETTDSSDISLVTGGSFFFTVSRPCALLGQCVRHTTQGSNNNRPGKVHWKEARPIHS